VDQAAYHAEMGAMAAAVVVLRTAGGGPGGLGRRRWGPHVLAGLIKKWFR
jgi:hypothetical protein